jgi:multidrug resistance efflux pump
VNIAKGNFIMSNLLTLLAEADETSIQLERARRELESAKLNLESAKQAYDQVISKADEAGVPRSKLKKLTEERLAALIETGLMSFPSTTPAAVRAVETKSERNKKVKAQRADSETEVGAKDISGAKEMTSVEEKSDSLSEPAQDLTDFAD